MIDAILWCTYAASRAFALYGLCAAAWVAGQIAERIVGWPV